MGEIILIQQFRKENLNLKAFLTNLGGGTARFKLLSETSNPFWAHATRRKATKNSWERKNVAVRALSTYSSIHPPIHRHTYNLKIQNNSQLLQGFYTATNITAQLLEYTCFKIEKRSMYKDVPIINRNKVLIKWENI